MTNNNAAYIRRQEETNTNIYHVFVLEVLLCSCDGLEALKRRIKQDFITSGISVVALSLLDSTVLMLCFI